MVAVAPMTVVAAESELTYINICFIYWHYFVTNKNYFYGRKFDDGGGGGGGAQVGGGGGGGGIAIESPCNGGGGGGGIPAIPMLLIWGGIGGASAKSWWGRSVWAKGFCAAKSLSAADPWRSPLESFLKAYDIVIGLLHKYWPFMASIAASDASKLAKLMKAKPFEFPVVGFSNVVMVLF